MDQILDVAVNTANNLIPAVNTSRIRNAGTVPGVSRHHQSPRRGDPHSREADLEDRFRNSFTAIGQGFGETYYDNGKDTGNRVFFIGTHYE